jgi:hypothetical protein
MDLKSGTASNLFTVPTTAGCGLLLGPEYPAERSPHYRYGQINRRGNGICCHPGLGLG